jgi:hypothetical protein
VLFQKFMNFARCGLANGDLDFIGWPTSCIPKASLWWGLIGMAVRMVVVG